MKLLRSRLHATDKGILVTPEIGRLKLSEAVAMLINDHKVLNRNTKKMQGRIDKHLIPFFGPNRLMSSITGAIVAEYKAKRKADVMVIPGRDRKTRGGWVHIPERRKPTADATINRELAFLKQMFTLAIEQDRLVNRPKITLIPENNVRQGYFEPEQYRAVLAHLPDDLKPVVVFARETGWRIRSEILSRQWRHVSFEEGYVQLDRGEAKNREPRRFYFTRELRAILEKQLAEHEQLKKRGRVVPWVFHRSGEPIRSFGKAFKAACRKAGCPGLIPHDLRRTAVRRFVRELGLPESVAMKLTGHKTQAVFKRYDI